jgi:hypothetical protein
MASDVCLMNLDFRATDDTSKKAEYFPVSDEVKSCYIVGTGCQRNTYLLFIIDELECLSLGGDFLLYIFSIFRIGAVFALMKSFS